MGSRGAVAVEELIAADIAFAEAVAATQAESGPARRWAGEDGVQLLIAWGDAEFTRGSKQQRLHRYLERLRAFPETIEPNALERAEMVSDLVVAPESLMRGFFRTPAGPGWALVGDAGEAEASEAALRKLHQTIRKVGSDVEGLRAGADLGIPIEVRDAGEAMRKARSLLGDAGRCARMGAAGIRLCAAHRGATGRHLAVVRGLLEAAAPAEVRAPAPG